MPDLTPVPDDERAAINALWRDLWAALHAHGLGHLDPVLTLSGTDARGLPFLLTAANLSASQTAAVLTAAASDQFAAASATINPN